MYKNTISHVKEEFCCCVRSLLLLYELIKHKKQKMIIMYSWQQKLRQRRINLWPWFFQNNSLQSSFSNIDLITTSSLGTYAQCYRDCFPCNFVKCTLVAQEIWIFELVNLEFFFVLVFCIFQPDIFINSIFKILMKLAMENIFSKYNDFFKLELLHGIPYWIKSIGCFCTDEFDFVDHVKWCYDFFYMLIRDRSIIFLLKSAILDKKLLKAERALQFYSLCNYLPR